MLELEPETIATTDSELDEFKDKDKEKEIRRAVSKS